MHPYLGREQRLLFHSSRGTQNKAATCSRLNPNLRLRPSQGEVHSFEPAFIRQPATSGAASTTDSGPGFKAAGPSSLQMSTLSGRTSDKTAGINTGGAPPPPPPLERAGLGSKASSRHRRQLPEESDPYTHEIVHFAYRHSDAATGRSQQQQQPTGLGGTSAGASMSSSPSLSAAAIGVEKKNIDDERAPSLRAQPSGRGGEQETNEGAEGGLKEQEHLARKRWEGDTGGGPDGRQRALLAPTAFRMSTAIGNGVGWGWDRGPFGAWPECPSSPRVLQIGIAMDTGYFKVCGAFSLAAYVVRFRSVRFGLITRSAPSTV